MVCTIPMRFIRSVVVVIVNSVIVIMPCMGVCVSNMSVFGTVTLTALKDSPQPQSSEIAQCCQNQWHCDTDAENVPLCFGFEEEQNQSNDNNRRNN